MDMNLIIQLVSGLITGTAVDKTVPGSAPGGMIGSVIAGIAGTMGASQLGMGAPGEMSGYAVNAVGGLVLPFIWKKFIGPMLGNKAE